MTPKALTDLQSSLGTDVLAFWPEVSVCLIIVLLLLVRLIPRFDRVHLGSVALVLTLYALYVALAQWRGTAYVPAEGSLTVEASIPDAKKDGKKQDKATAASEKKTIKRASGRLEDSGRPHVAFGGMLIFDNFTIFLRMILLGFAALVIWLSMLTGIPDREDSADFYVLLLGATLGMMLMASAYHLMMVFIGVEMASLPSYALAGFLKGRRQSSEASLKYVVYGGGAAGVMLYGISLIAGKFGTGYLPLVAEGFRAAPADPMLLLGAMFILIGIGFKLAAVPFHFWAPDVFEGAAAEVGAFLSVASKAAALALLARITLVMAGPSDLANNDAWIAVARNVAPAVAFFAAITATFGNLAAYAQTNLKRLLAYSTIAHAGYMMMGLATLTRGGAGAVLFYLVAYLFMNLGAFAVVAFLRNLTGSEDLSSFRGLVQRAPLLVVTLGIFLLSLLGLPPLAGFAAKFQVFAAVFEAGNLYAVRGESGLSYTMYSLLVIGGLNTVISLLYYVKVLKVMVLERPLEEVEGGAPEPLRVPYPVSLYALALSAMILFVGIFWGPLDHASRERGVKGLEITARASAAAPAEVQETP